MPTTAETFQAASAALLDDYSTRGTQVEALIAENAALTEQLALLQARHDALLEQLNTLSRDTPPAPPYVAPVQAD